MADISENLFQAIDILTAKRLQGLKYDKTLLCEILDDTKAERGEYRVSDGSSTFTAYSDVTTYKNGISVYVTIPEGDYSQRKIITGKYVQDGGEYYTYIAPFDSYLDITNNFIETNIGERSLLANGATTEIPIFEWHRADNEVIPKEYSRMGLKADFRTWLGYLQPVTGSYGLRIDIVSREVQTVISDEESHKNYSYYLDSSDFYGDIYNFETFYQQELVFDISMITEIQDLRITFYQSNNFYDITKTKIPTMDGGELLEDNIFLQNVYLSFGFDASQFVEDEVFLYTLDGETYDVSGASVKGKDGQIYNKNVKLLQARWVHFLTKSQALMIDHVDDFNPDEATLHWYKYKQEDGVYDELAGDLWEEIPNTVNTFSLEVTPDIKEQHEYYKLIVECPNATWVDENARLQIANLGSVEEYGVVDENGNWTTKGSLHKNRTDLMTEIEALETAVNNGTDKVGDRAVLATKKQQLTSIETSLDSFKNSVVQIWKDYNAMKKLYYSDVLTLTNETLVPSTSNLELVDGLNIIVDEGGYKGNYAIYGMTNEIMKSTDAMKTRTLEAVYKSIITKDESLNKASSICWRIPVDATMITEPVLGQDYVTEAYVKTLDAKTQKKYTEFDYIAMTMDVNGTTVNLVDTITGELIPYEGFYWLIRKGTEVYHDDNENGEAPTSQQISVKQTYKIKKYYQQSAKNNTVYCDVIKNGFTYRAQATMTFGLHGTNGTDNTLLLQLRRYKFEGDKVVPMDLVSVVHPGQSDIMIEARLFDYNNNELQIEDVDWSMFAKGNSSALYVDTTDKLKIRYTRTQKTSSVDDYGELVEGTEDITIHCIPVIAGTPKDNDLTPFMHNIVQADVFYGNCTVGATSTGGVDFENVTNTGVPAIKTVTPQTRQVYLTSYMPIPFATTPNLIWAEIPTQVVYDASGASPSYYKDPIKICNADGNYVTINECKIVHGDEAKNNAYYPTVKTTELGFSIKPLNMFLHDLSKQITLQCTVNGVGTWLQPILMIQNKWPSAVLNEWDGSLTIDEKNGTILSTMVGAGKKEGDNTFTGVLMGDIATGADINTAQTGVYGYHHGVQSFGFKDDGTAFIGKPGKGQIIFNGNSGKIQSMSYSVSGATGMMIDLDDGIIEMKGANGEAGANLNTQKKVYTSSGSLIRLDVNGGTSKPYFLIQGTTADYNTVDKTIDASKTVGESSDLIYIGVNKYYLKTLDYKKASNTDNGSGGQGMKIDLAKGSIEGYNFSLKGYCNDPDNSEYNGSYFSLNSNGNPFFRIHFEHEEYDEVSKQTEQRSINLVEITRSKFELKSHNYNTTNRTGMFLDMSKGQLKGYDFALESYGHDTAARVRLSNISPYFYVNNSAGKRLIYMANSTETNTDGTSEVTDSRYYLQSSDFSSSNRAGMKIDLESGKIEAYDFTLKTASSDKDDESELIISSNSTPAYIRVVDAAGITLLNMSKTSYYLQSSNKKAKLDLDNATLTFQGNGGGEVVMTGNGSPFFKINDGTTNIFYASNGSYYMQSSGYSSSAGGVKINFTNGTMEGGETGKTWSILKNGHATFNSLDIKTNATIDGNVTIKGTLTVTNPGCIQSGSSGAYYKLTTAGGTIGGWEITTTSIKKNNIELNSSTGFIRAGTAGGNRCQMNTDGKFFANYGEIGGWTISTKEISKGNTVISSENGGRIKVQASSGGWIGMGYGTSHPAVSGLNVAATQGISFRSGLGVSSDGSQQASLYIGARGASGTNHLIVGGGNFAVDYNLWVDGTANFNGGVFFNEGVSFSGIGYIDWGSDVYDQSFSFDYDYGMGLGTNTFTITFRNGLCTGCSIS